MLDIMLWSSLFFFLTLVLKLYEVEAKKYQCEKSMGIGCSPCGEGTRCHYCEWCVGYCYNGGTNFEDFQGRYRREASGTGNITHGNITYGSQIMSYKVPYLEMFKDVEEGLLADIFSETDIVEIFKITSVATAQDCAICNSTEIAEISNFTQTVYVELEEAAANGTLESFKEIALNRTSDTTEKLEELPETLEILVSPTSPIIKIMEQEEAKRQDSY